MQIKFANPVHAIIASHANTAATKYAGLEAKYTPDSDSFRSLLTLDQWSSSSALCSWILAMRPSAECGPSDCIADLWATITAILMD